MTATVRLLNGSGAKQTTAKEKERERDSIGRQLARIEKEEKGNGKQSCRGAGPCLCIVVYLFRSQTFAMAAPW